MDIFHLLCRLVLLLYTHMQAKALSCHLLGTVKPNGYASAGIGMKED
jgi:hypothetical protein